MGPGRTGVKGVIRDRDEAEELHRQKRNVQVEEMRRKMEKSSLVGKTFLEEEREKGPGEKVDEIVAKEREKERKDVFGRPREGKFGHLREVDVHNFLSSVEKEERGIWVVVHLYESVRLCRCVTCALTQPKTVIRSLLPVGRHTHPSSARVSRYEISALSRCSSRIRLFFKV